MYVTVTAYSSTPDQTDDSPFITANGTRVRDGIVAANFLRFGTRVRFPDHSGGKVFVVTDRMHQRFSDRMDIWMETREEAQRFGIRRLKVEVY
jgi:3D (Asp-Asp-Asp) domain-containing protein